MERRLMETRRQPTLRTLIMLLALVNLAILAIRLWPRRRRE